MGIINPGGGFGNWTFGGSRLAAVVVVDGMIVCLVGWLPADDVVVAVAVAVVAVATGETLLISIRPPPPPPPPLLSPLEGTACMACITVSSLVLVSLSLSLLFMRVKVTTTTKLKVGAIGVVGKDSSVAFNKHTPLHDRDVIHCRSLSPPRNVVVVFDFSFFFGGSSL